MSPQPHEELQLLEREVKANLVSPSAETVAFLNDALKRLRAIPFDIDPKRRVNCLIDIASQFYHQGQNTFNGVEPAALAVMVARDVDDQALLRKALTVQAVILYSTNNPGDALTALAEALDIAEQIADSHGKVAVWINLGTAFYEAALYADARDCAERATRLATGMAQLLPLKAIALGNVALYCTHMQEYEQGLQAIRDSIALRHAPDNPAEMLTRVFAEGTYTRLLLALGRSTEAFERAQIAKELAPRAKSIRADISAACSEGLVEVYSGLGDVGLSRGMAALEKARAVKPSLRETLLALVQAHEKAGRPERALALHRELTLHIRKAQHDSIVRHQELHLQQIEAAQQFPEHLLTDKEAELSDKIAAQTAGTRQGDLLEQIAFTAEMRDDPTGEHCYRVAKLSSLLAKALGQSDDACESIDLAARLHDIGKVGIPDSLMQKPQPLSEGERQILRTHAATGADLLSKTKVSYSDLASDIARHHHERWDGNGYPEGISGSAIPLAARIVGLCDSYDALTHEKAYRRAFSSDEAIGEILRLRELQFDPNLVDVFVPMVMSLRREHDNLDDFLGAAARQTALNAARLKIAESLAKPIEGLEPLKPPPTIERRLIPRTLPKPPVR
ncbi:MAG TPA: HD domain-containing phosphohydrolase [Burkholderiaceae bacterium]|nr:HD domain-containing phosphohydrolase [Burkholderiaceae bacterium]